MSVVLNHLKSNAALPLRPARRRVENRGLALLGLLLLLASGSASAFPPAPYYTLYGMVRDQVGQTVTAEGAVVILLKGRAEVGRTPITANQLDQGYELNVRIDQNRSGTTFYTEKAVAAGGLFSMVVSMNGELFYPIEVSGNLTAGRGAERVRLDLMLGEDKDKDGLPDAWEAWQLYQAGYHPDENGEWDLTLIDRDGDFSGSLAGDVTGTQSETSISAATVTGKALTGFASAAGTVTASDSILSAINKLNGNDGLKANVDSPTFTGTVGGVTSGMVGLGDVDNTSDASKPVSAAQQSALNLKANLASPAFTGSVQLPAGTVTAAPLKLVSGTNLTAPSFGAVEFDGTNLYLTNR